MQSHIAKISAEDLCPIRLARELEREFGVKAARVYIEGGPTGLVSCPLSHLVVEQMKDEEVVETPALLRRLIRRNLSMADVIFAVECGLALGWLEPYDEEVDDNGLPRSVVRNPREDLSIDAMRPDERRMLRVACGEMAEAFEAEPALALSLPELAARIVPAALSHKTGYEAYRTHIIKYLIDEGLLNLSVDRDGRPVFYSPHGDAAAEHDVIRRSAGLAPAIAQAKAIAIASSLDPQSFYSAEELFLYNDRHVSWEYMMAILEYEDIIRSFTISEKKFYFLNRDPSHYALFDFFSPAADPVDVIKSFDSPAIRFLQAFNHFPVVTPAQFHRVYTPSFWTHDYPDPSRTLARLQEDGLVSVKDPDAVPTYRQYEITPLGQEVERRMSKAVRPPKRDGYEPRDHDSDGEEVKTA